LLGSPSALTLSKTLAPANTGVQANGPTRAFPCGSTPTATASGPAATGAQSAGQTWGPCRVEWYARTVTLAAGCVPRFFT
jgi:hypothetical protein